jgi:site-specific recombinase XerD
LTDRTLLPSSDWSQTSTDPVTMTALGFLAQFANRNTRAAYMTDLRIYFAWCSERGLNPLAVKRAHVQAFALHLAEGRGNSPASIGRRIGTVKGFYTTAVQDDVIEFSPADHVKVPAIHDDPAKRTWLTRWELGAVVRAARESRQPADWALVTLLGTLGMRVSAACAVQLGDLSKDAEGYRLLHTVGKGDKPSVKVLPIPTWAAIDRAAGGRDAGPLLLRRDGTQMTRRSAAVVIARLCRTARVDKHITPHSLRRSFATLALQAGVPVEVVQFDMDHASTRTTLIYNRLGVEVHARASHTVAALLASAS